MMWVVLVLLLVLVSQVVKLRADIQTKEDNLFSLLRSLSYLSTPDNKKAMIELLERCNNKSEIVLLSHYAFKVMQKENDILQEQVKELSKFIQSDTKVN